MSAWMTEIQFTRAWLVEEMRGHQAADRLVQGEYWDDGKGCAVGCAMRSLDPNAAPHDHARYAEMIGAPEMLVRLEDCIFEGLPGALAIEWPVRFTIALRDSGADEEALRRACVRFLHAASSRGLDRYGDTETRAPMSADEERVAALRARSARNARAETAWAADATDAASAASAAERAVQALALASSISAESAAGDFGVAAYTEMADALIEEIEAAS